MQRVCAVEVVSSNTQCMWSLSGHYGEREESSGPIYFTDQSLTASTLGAHTFVQIVPAWNRHITQSCALSGKA